MKKFVFLVLLFVGCNKSEDIVENNIDPEIETNGAWTKVSDVPSAVKRYEAISFVINNFAYIGLGSDFNYDTVNYPGVYNGGYKSDIWKYNINDNSWTQVAEFPGEPRCGAVSFSLNNKGYVGLGYTKDPNKTLITKKDFKDFWEYNPITDNWTQLSDFPGKIREGSVCYTVNNIGYLGLGGSNTESFNDFWKFDPNTNLWTQLASYPGSARTRAVGFVINNNIYAGLGGDSIYPLVNYDDFWKYSISNNTWSQISSNISNDTENGRTNMTGFSVGNNGYIIGGNNINFRSPFRKGTYSMSIYNSNNDTWTINKPSDFFLKSMVSFSYKNRVFIGLGCSEIKYNHNGQKNLGTSIYEFVF